MLELFIYLWTKDKRLRLRARPGSCAFAAAAAWLAGFGFAAPSEPCYCVVIIKSTVLVIS